MGSHVCTVQAGRRSPIQLLLKAWEMLWPEAPDSLPSNASGPDLIQRSCSGLGLGTWGQLKNPRMMDGM